MVGNEVGAIVGNLVGPNVVGKLVGTRVGTDVITGMFELNTPDDPIATITTNIVRIKITRTVSCI